MAPGMEAPDRNHARPLKVQIIITFPFWWINNLKLSEARDIFFSSKF